MISKLNFVDLYCGCGGLSEGFISRGHKPVLLADYDKYAMESSANRLRYYNFDRDYLDRICLTIDLNVTKIPSQIKNLKIKNLDVLLSGIPCQAFSTVGRAQDKNSMKKDKRNYLYKTLMMYIEFLKPKIVIIENVSGLLTAKPKDKFIIEEIFRELSSLSYDVNKNKNEILINSAEFGVPQIRKRTIICGISKSLGIKSEKFYSNLIKTHYLPGEENNQKGLEKYINVIEAIGDLPKLKPGEGSEVIHDFMPILNRYTKLIRGENNKILYNHTARNHNINDINRYKLLAKNKWKLKDLLRDYPELVHHDPKHFGNRYTVQDFDLPSKTIVSHLYKDGNLFIHPDSKQHRTFTVREAARIQSFPDDFLLAGSRTQQFKQIGNAVPAMLSSAIAKSIESLL